MGACTRILDLCKTSAFIMKLVELTLGLICVGLVSGHLFPTNAAKLQTIYATLFGFFMLEVVIVLGYLLDYPLQRIVVLVICAVAAIMYLVSGSLLIEAWRTPYYVHDNVLGTGILSILNSLLYAVDVCLTLMKCRSDTTNIPGQA